MNLAVIGLGKLGLPLAALLASNGNQVKAFDAQESVRRAIRQKTIETNEPGLIDLLKNDNNQLEISESIAESIKGAEAVFIIVPTPSLPSGHFTNEYLLDVITKIGQSIEPSQKLVIDIVSTVMPGSCDGPIKSALEQSAGRSVGEDLGLCYNPEFIALGSVINDMENPDMHLIGQSSDWAGEVVENALKSIVKVQVPSMRMSLTEAELVKIAVNNFVTMKISFANALYQAGVALGGMDIDVVTSAIGLDSRIGNKYLKGAAPYGGPCFPRDTRALTTLFEELGVLADLSRATEALNKSHVSFISDFVKKSVGNVKTVGLVGISYKPGTPVTEESPGVSIAIDLVAQGYELHVWDDENAQLPPGLHEKATYSEELGTLVERSDFVVITRPTANLDILMRKLDETQKPFLDLWRQQR